MINAKILDQVSAAVSNVLPSQLSSDVKKNMRAALQSALEGLDLVTREELEVQEAVLARTREKLQELEKKIAALEKQLLGKK
jgi:BMFP domain-containing protein YqiC